MTAQGKEYLGFVQVAGLFVLCGALAACTTNSTRFGTAATPLQPQPTTAVTAQPLAPPPGTVLGPDGEAIAADDAQQLASLEPTPEEVAQAARQAETEAVDIQPSDLAGGWRVSSGGSSCQLITSQTAWTGGFRASTRGCANPTLASIGAWNVNGRQVVLLDGEGTQIATLFGASKTQFNGQTTTGQAISFGR